MVSGLIIGADGGIGGTYVAMPEIYIKIMELVKKGDNEKACKFQNMACDIIYTVLTCHGDMYSTIKEIVKIRDCIDCGGARKPLAPLIDSDLIIVEKCVEMIDVAIAHITFSNLFPV